MPRTRILVVAFDSVDQELLARLTAAGALPALQGLLEAGAQAPLDSSFGFVSNYTWTTFATGVDAGTHGRYTTAQQVPGTYEVHVMAPQTRYRPYWEVLSAHGRQVVTVDVPEAAPPDPELHGVQVNGWGRHEHHTPFAATPAGLGTTLLERYGTQPDDCRRYVRTNNLAGLRDDLVAGIERKQKLCLDLVADDWDVFTVAFTEAHCAGHQLWAWHDAAHPAHDRAPDDSGDPLGAVARAHDRAIGALVESVGPETQVLAVWNRTMGPNYDATVVLDRILDRILRRVDPPSRYVEMRERARRATRSAVRRFRRAPPETVRYLRAVDGGRAFHRAPNDAAYGAVRFNLRGREPAGQISPGREADELYQTLTRELSTWTNLDTGSPLFTRIERVDDHYSGTERDRLPDMVVEYERGAPVRRVRSPEYGTIEGRYRGTRTGDHYPGGRVIARAPGIAAGRALAPVSLVDLAPTICAAAGAKLPAADGAVRHDLIPS